MDYDSENKLIITNQFDCEIAEDLWVELINLNPSIESPAFKRIESIIYAIDRYKEKLLHTHI